MVRREEQRWQDRAVVILDSRRSAHVGTGPSSSFEFAVSAAASIGLHLARAGLDGHLLTDAGPLAGPAMFEDVLLDALSVVSTSRNHDFARTTAALSTIEGGLLVLIAGRLTVDAAREIATSRRHGRQGIALLLAVSTWAANPGKPRPGDASGQDPRIGTDAEQASANSQRTGAENGRAKQTRLTKQASQILETSQNGILAAQANGTAGGNGAQNGRKTDGLTAATDLPAGSMQVSISGAGPPSSGDSALLAAGSPAGSGAAQAAVAETAAAAAVLRAGGWRVITIDATTPLAVAWQQLPRSGSALMAASERGFGTSR
jgi:uncharacterized protein (DUF58 family)